MEKDTNMQDKEFDDLFRTKLNNFETEPSVQVWQSIDAELDGKKRKMGIFPILRVAASIIILITAGVLFIPKKEVIKPGHPQKNSIANNKVERATAKPGNNTPVKTNEQVAELKIPIKPVYKPRHTKKMEIPANPNIQVQDNQLIVKSDPVKVVEDQPVLAVVQKKSDEVVKPVIETAVGIKEVNTNETPVLQSQPVLASTPTPAAKENKPVVRRRGIHNFGDLVNLVVAKVDKRKDKVIEFTDTDGDESTITGLHIGSIKIKRDN